MANDTRSSSPDVAEWIGEVVTLERQIDGDLDHLDTYRHAPPIVQNLHRAIHASRMRAEAFFPAYKKGSATSTLQRGLALLEQSPLLIERIGDGKMSHVFRDCFVACNLAAITYAMLHTSAIALENEELAGFAVMGLRTYSELVSEIGSIMSDVVVNDLVHSDTNARIDPNAAVIASSQQPGMWERNMGNGESG